jgi:predicted pyridoxine 5'-phosphate oxidase superfamily flavin-nucleotide-binding protein
MSNDFLHQLFTPAVLDAQERAYGRRAARPEENHDQPLGAAELEFLAERDSFYLATVTSEGWPYVQHRGGPAGFLKAIGPRTLAFADLKGNRQLISTGNLSGGSRVAIIAVDYPNRQRLKLLGHARVVDAVSDRALVERLTAPQQRRAVERVIAIDVIASDWNCPAHITPRFTVPEIETLVAPLQQRIAALEAELATLRAGERGRPFTSRR